MIRLTIRHQTTYRYRKPVILHPHRLMLRPREAHDLRLLSFEVTITPDATLAWSRDVAGNTIATASFHAMTDRLSIGSRAEVELDAEQWPVFDIAASAIFFPFRYSDDELIDLGAMAIPQYPDDTGALRDWVRAFIHAEPADTLSLLKDINAWIPASIPYRSRDDEGTYTPVQTLELRQGTCRDFSVLLVEAARCLGFGARLVSGYLYNPDEAGATPGLGQTTHAWAEIYLPGAGWIAFDPTNATVGGGNLVPVAVGRDIRQVAPVAGSYAGARDDFIDMSPEVFVAA